MLLEIVGDGTGGRYPRLYMNPIPPLGGTELALVRIKPYALFAPHYSSLLWYLRGLEQDIIAGFTYARPETATQGSA